MIDGFADYQVAESLKLELDYSDEKSDFRKTNFPARYIYERLLPSVVESLCDVHYHRSSPYSGFGKVTTDRNYGDLHQCERLSLSALPVNDDPTLRLRRECVARVTGAMG